MKLFRNKDLFQFSECLLIKAQRLLEEMRTTRQIIHSVVLPQASPIFKTRLRGREGLALPQQKERWEGRRKREKRVPTFHERTFARFPRLYLLAEVQIS